MKIACWIVAVLLILIGGGWLALCLLFQPVHEAEVVLMKRGGKFEGEEDYMQQFRVARSEWDLDDNARYIRHASSLLGIGLLLVVSLLAI